MGLGASRSKQDEGRASAERSDGVVDAASGASEPKGEMKRMAPRLDGDAITMERLERAVTQLVAGQDALLARIESLEKALSEREIRVRELEEQLSSGEENRALALDRLDLLIEQLDELEGRAESAASVGADPQ